EKAGGGTLGFQPRIVPDSVANANTAGPWNPACFTMNAGVPLNTVPVGAPATSTINGIAFPSASYSVETSFSLSATHHGEVGPAARPHALTRFGSVCIATPGSSETSRVTRYELAPGSLAFATDTDAIVAVRATAEHSTATRFSTGIPSLGASSVREVLRMGARPGSRLRLVEGPGWMGTRRCRMQDMQLLDAERRLERIERLLRAAADEARSARLDLGLDHGAGDRWAKMMFGVLDELDRAGG